jgi:hypothetical protein
VPTSSRAILTLSFLWIVAVAVCFSVLGSPQARQQQVRFVGCPSDGQAEYFAPPRESPKSVSLTDVAANEIAYYKGEAAPGAFGPSGWNCHVWYGSGGGILLITPQVLDSARGSAWPAKTSGQAVELSFDSGENSGRFDVAKYAFLFFSQDSAGFVKWVNELGIHQISKDSIRPFAKDSVKAITGTFAEFVTPANSSGFGTERYLNPSPDPISGFVLLDQSHPSAANIVTIRVRLKASSSQLKSAILRLNQECMQRQLGCSTR